MYAATVVRNFVSGFQVCEGMSANGHHLVSDVIEFQETTRVHAVLF